MYPNFSYNGNFGQNMMASMIQAIQASKSSESSLASLRNLRTFLLLIEINMLGTNLETGGHIYPWLWSNQCRWSLTPKLYVQNHQIHQKKRFFKSGCWYNDDTHPPRWGQTWLSCCGKISQVKLGYSSFWTSPNFFAYPCTMCIRAEKWGWAFMSFPCTFGWTWWCFTLPTDRGTWTQPEAFWIWTIDTRGLKPDCGQNRKVNSVVGFLK